jgi:hypothetical protein
MKHLLERWAELEPGECGLSKDWDEYATDKTWDIQQGEDLIKVDPDYPSDILYAVLMCCEKRGWTIAMGFTGIRWTIDIERDLWHSDKANSPAEAALSAYIKALEAEHA